MKASPNTPMYNLKAVVQETGLKPDTLRAWERRYGLPEPQRTDSGHRLYSQNDIYMLKWLSLRQEEGMSISRAVELWKSLQNGQGNALLAQPELPNEASVAKPAAPQAIQQGDTLVELHDAWVAHCLNFEEQGAERVIAQACAMLPVEVVCLELLQRGLATIGEAWYKGKATVQQEHFASSLAMRRLEALLAVTPPPVRTGRILVGCPPEEEHVFAPLLLTLLLRRKGWDVLFLGANLPLQNIILTIQTAKPTLIILTAQQLYTAASLAEMAQLLYREHIPLAFGGKVFTEIRDLRQRIAGHYLGERLEFVGQAVEQVMNVPQPQPASKLAPPLYWDTLARFRGHQASIEAEVWKMLGQLEIPPEHLSKVNLHFGRNIIAGLILGNIEYAGGDLVWVKGLLSNHYQMPPHLVDEYLTIYLRALETHLGSQGQLIIQWLQRILGKGNA